MKRVITNQIAVTDWQLMQANFRLEQHLNEHLSNSISEAASNFKYLDVHNFRQWEITSGRIGDDFIRGIDRFYIRADFDLHVKPHLKKRRRVSWIRQGRA